MREFGIEWLKVLENLGGIQNQRPALRGISQDCYVVGVYVKNFPIALYR